MSLIRFSPVREIANLQHDLDRIFNMTTDFAPATVSYASPILQVWETGDVYTVRLLAPGIERDSLTIEAGPNGLTISGKAKFAAPAQAKLRHAEFGDSEFRRSLKLTHTIKTDAVVADYVDGVLTLTLPKADTAKVVKVQLQGSQEIPLSPVAAGVQPETAAV